jgi:RecB family endonuclease NucS
MDDNDGMRIVVAHCHVTYIGRSDTVLPGAVRAIMIKSDGSVAIHDDVALQPRNWMVRPRTVVQPPLARRGETEWIFGNAREKLTIRLQNVLSDVNLPLDGDAPPLVKKGTERELQRWLAAYPDAWAPGWVFCAREFPTGAGPVDLLMLDQDGTRVAVEVKRVAAPGAVDQVSRYTEALAKDGEPVHGAVVAWDVRPRARALAEQRGFDWIEVDRSTLIDTDGTSSASSS